MADDQTTETGIGSFEFILFLILIMLFLGNSKTFEPHFELLNSQVNKVNQIINMLSATAEGLQGAFTAPRKAMEDLSN